MTAQGWLQIAIYLAVLTALTPLLGAYMARVYTERRVFLSPVLAPVERLAYRAIRVDPEAEQDWKAYARTVVVFSALFWLALYAILRTQGIQPFNPEGLGSGPWDLSFNTASSFVTNTNWQFYGGEATLSYFSQMVGLTVQNFVSAAVGMAVLAAVIRGFASRGAARARQLLGGPHPHPPLHPAAALAPRRAPARLPGRHPDPRRLPHLHHRAGRRADAGARPGRLAGRDQAARHQRRRLLQRQQRDALREPDRALELRRGAVHPPDPGSADRHLRPHGRQPPPGLGAVRGDGGDAGRRDRRHLRRRAARHPGRARGRDRDRGRRRARAAATCRTRSSASGSPPAPSGRPRRPPPPTARSTPATTPTPAPGARC